MQFTWQELVDRARVYCDDDHKDTDGWIAPATWLALANVEYAQLYRRWIRQGLVSTAPTDFSFANYQTTLAQVLAIVGVAEDMTNYFRGIPPMQPSGGRSPIWHASGAPTGKAMGYSVTGDGDNLTVTLEPRDTDATYVVRYLSTPARATDLSQSIDLPYGCDERLVLGIARRAHLKDSTASVLLERLLMEADAELAFTASARLPQTPLIRVSARVGLYAPDVDPFPSDPRLWRFV